ncbi:MAG: VWA domain-containing protein [Bifidobacteriaceae bacterium]|nr:VWA domain-containing protein [Bifidobacteriaceae bacterium]
MTFLTPWLGALVAAGTAAAGIVAWRRSGPNAGGTRLANTARVAQLSTFRQAVRRHHLAAVWAVVAGLTATLGVTILAARPVDTETVHPQARSRDVVLCLDVSGSMYPVDAAILRQFEQIVAGFEGERVAMSWFNSSSVTIFPLTDDYEFIKSTLGPAEEQFETVADVMSEWDLALVDPEDVPDLSGTLLGNGSSLPGDGLASCLGLFDQKDSDRPRSVILATDNMVEGDPIFELPEAAELAVEAGVRVYALCPEGVFYAGSSGFLNYTDPAASSELRQQAETTGGAYFSTEDSESVSAVVDQIMAQEATLVDQGPVRLVYDRPAFGVACLIIGLVGVGVWGGWRAQPAWRAWARRGGLALGAALMVWNPTFGADTFQLKAVDADVFVLVDTSPSVAAEDWGERRPRLDGVKADLAAMAEHHVGAHISIIAFDAEARTVMPLTTDVGALLAAADTLTPTTTLYATGSSIDAGLDALVEALETSRQTHPERARLVYYLGDGEQTTEEEVRSFAPAQWLVDGGAVFGYGTADGGKMRQHLPFGAPDPAPGQEYILAPDGSVGISQMDQEALAKIASELGVEHTTRTAETPANDAFWSGELPERTLETKVAGERPVAAWAALAISPLIAWELAFLLRRLRKSHQAVRLAGPGAGGLGARPTPGVPARPLRQRAPSSLPLPTPAPGQAPPDLPPWGTGAWR